MKSADDDLTALRWRGDCWAGSEVALQNPAKAHIGTLGVSNCRNANIQISSRLAIALL